MFRQLDSIPSRSLGRAVHLWRFGHYGQPLLVFPSSAGIAHEWEHNGLVQSLDGMLAAGRVKLYCTESNVSESWLAHGDPATRVRRHQAFERYVVQELVPGIRLDCRTPGIRIWVAGTSVGAFYAASFVLKRPDLFEYALCLSGRYDATWLTEGYDSPEVFLSNPAAFTHFLGGWHLELLRRRAHLDLICGQGPWEGANIQATREFAAILRSKGISHRLELWGAEAAHDWYWWNRQALHYLTQRLG